MPSRFTPGQVIFIDRFATNTGLDKNVVAAWVYSEQNGSAAQYYENKKFFNWLNIGVTDSGSYGTGNSFWSSPVSAADASATWLQGGYIPGFGYASSGIRRIAQTAGMSPLAQISAIQNSGWASSHYPNLPSVYASLAGSKYPSVAQAWKKEKKQAGLFSGGVTGILNAVVPSFLKPLDPFFPSQSKAVGQAVGGPLDTAFGTVGKYVVFGLTILGGGLLMMLSLAMIAADIGIEQIREPRPVRGVRRGLVKARVAKARTATTASQVQEAKARREAEESRRTVLHAARVKTEQAKATELRSRSRARSKQIRITKEEREKIERQGYMKGFADREHHEED